METQSITPNSSLVHSTAGDGYASGVSWGAVLAGAAAAAALSFILLILGVGLGLSSISPYSYSSTAIGWPTIAWLAFMQLAASGVGGYLAGRLRVKWANVQGDEVHFRDTAHGLLAWAVATLVTVAVLAGGAHAALGGAIDAGTAVAPAITVGANTSDRRDSARLSNPSEYFSDMALRSSLTEPASDVQRAEVGRLLMHSLASGSMTPEDRTYLGQVIAKRNGVSQADAERRVDEIYTDASKAAAEAKAKAQAMADKARKAAAYAALWMFVALLLGAFISSLSATLGGRQRDHDRVVLRSSL